MLSSFLKSKKRPMVGEPEKKQLVPISSLKNWDRNPRGIERKAFDRLKRQIAKYGQYKPLIITEDGTVIGGNMRLRAYRDLGITDVWVSIVNPKTEEEKVGIALSDNDRAGYYEEEPLAELTLELPELDLGDFHIDLAQKPLEDLVGDLSNTKPEVEKKGNPQRVTILFAKESEVEGAIEFITDALTDYRGYTIKVG